MSNINPDKPVILVLAGHDPSGGAGIQADIESIASQGCHAATVITSLTAQNTVTVGTVIHQRADNFREQIETLLDDLTIAACKIGLVADESILDVIQDIVATRLHGIPLVLDPVITSGSGYVFVDKSVQSAICNELLPYTRVCTPNTIEAATLTGKENPYDAAQKLIASGTHSVLITGGSEEEAHVFNTLYMKGKEPLKYRWDRLPGTYHGSGCTLSASIAANLAKGEDIEMAVQKAQVYTWNSLKYANRFGQSQYHPERFFWNNR